MRLSDILRISLRAISTNKARAVLTTLGIVIGISAVIALLSLGQGAQNSILEQVQGLGSNTINILPGGSFSFSSFGGGGASQSALKKIANGKIDHRVIALLENKVNFPEIAAISPQTNDSFDLSYQNNLASGSTLGVRETYFDVANVTAAKGRVLNADDNAKYRKYVVLGSTTATKLFGESDPINKTIKVGTTNFKVVGVTTAKGTSVDSNVFIPLNVATVELSGNRDYSQVVVKVTDDALVDETAVKIDQKLRAFYKVPDGKEAGFSLLTSKDVLSIAQSVTTIFTALLASIAGISLVVGGIGIMNIMLVSVSERTKEIGLRKAVGAKQNAILGQFLMESVVLTLLGGTIGIILGLLLAEIIGKVAGIPVILSLQSILLATSVSATIGIVFGFYPAYRAARLNPIDALRYE